MILNLKKGKYKIRTRDKVGPYILQFTGSAVPLEFKISRCVSVTFEMIIIHIPSGVLSHAGKKKLRLARLLTFQSFLSTPSQVHSL